MKITESDFHNAAISQDAAPDIIMATQIALLARGVVDADEVVDALLAAAWYQQRETDGSRSHKAFAAALRRMADTIERSELRH